MIVSYSRGAGARPLWLSAATLSTLCTVACSDGAGELYPDGDAKEETVDVTRAELAAILKRAGILG